MQLDADVVAVLAVVATALSGLLLLVVVVMGLRLRALRRTYRAALGDEGAQDLIGAVRGQADSLTSLRTDLEVVHRNTERLRDLHREAVSRVGLVRYDAFPDMGGMLSFSAALLDERGTGVVISAINGRQETRAYGKPVVEGESEHSLSDEERDAVVAAMDGSGPGGSLAQPAARTRRGRRG